MAAGTCVLEDGLNLGVKLAVLTAGVVGLAEMRRLLRYSPHV